MVQIQSAQITRGGYLPVCFVMDIGSKALHKSCCVCHWSLHIHSCNLAQVKSVKIPLRGKRYQYWNTYHLLIVILWYEVSEVVKEVKLMQLLTYPPQAVQAPSSSIKLHVHAIFRMLIFEILLYSNI